MNTRHLANVPAPALVAGWCLALAAFPLRAQRPDTTATDTATIRLPTIEVVGSILAPAGPRVGSGIPARTESIPRTAIEAWEPGTLADALSGTAGMSLYDDLGSPFKTTLVTRGFTASPVVGLPQGVSVFIDGVPVNEPDAGQVNFDLLPLDHIREIELLSGTASLLGPHSLAGAVNLVTRRGRGAPGGRLEVSGGSFGARAVDGSAGGEGRGWSWFGGGGWATEEGWRHLTSATQYDGLLTLTRPLERGGFDGQLFAASSYAETAGSLPESVFGSRPDSNLTAGDFEDLRQLHAAVYAWHELAKGRASVGLWLRRHEAERFNVNQATDPDVRSFSENRTIGAHADWRTTVAVGESLLGLRLGATGSASHTDVRIFAERIDPGITTHVQSPIHELGGHAVGDWVVGPLTFSGGARVDWVVIPFRNRLDAARDTTSSYLHASPRVGLSWALTSAATVYASLGRSFRAPAVIELACADPQAPCPLPFALGDDPPLDPVSATTREIGARWERGTLVLGASAYRTEVRDEILLFPYDDASEPEGSTIDGYFDNVARTRREGIELVARMRPHASIELHATGAWTRATFRTGGFELFSIREQAGGENDVEVGDRLPLVPSRTFAMGADLELPRGLRAGVDARRIGPRFLRGDEANEEPSLPGWSTTAVRLGLVRGPWEARVIVRNVFDSEHATFGTFNIHQAAGGVVERFLTPGAPRTIRVVIARSIGG